MAMTTFCAGVPVVFSYLNDVLLNKVHKFSDLPEVIHLANADGEIDLYLVRDLSNRDQGVPAAFVCICGGAARGIVSNGVNLCRLRDLVSVTYTEGGADSSKFDGYFMDEFLAVVAVEMLMLSGNGKNGVKLPNCYIVPGTKRSSSMDDYDVDRVLKVPDWYVETRATVSAVLAIYDNYRSFPPVAHDLVAGDGARCYTRPLWSVIRALLATHGIAEKPAAGTPASTESAETTPKKPKRSTRVRELLWNSYPHVCGICGNQIDSFDEMHVDHIIPLSRGGKDILANLQLTHANCNLKKGSDMPEGDDEEADDDT